MPEPMRALVELRAVAAERELAAYTARAAYEAGTSPLEDWEAAEAALEDANAAVLAWLTTPGPPLSTQARIMRDERADIDRNRADRSDARADLEFEARRGQL